MRRLLGALCACSLLLTACGGPAAPAEPPAPLTEAEVLAAYDEAAEVYGWFDLAPLPTVGEAVEADGGVYRPVAYDGLSTYGDLEARVRACFAPALADAILEAGAGYRDIGGKLHCAGGGRGENLYLLDRTVAAAQVDEDHWTVTLTFWADSYEWERPEATVGYSQKTLDYERTADGWRFTSFCPGDALDLDAETVFRFSYSDAFFEEQDMETWSDLQLACWLLHADGAFSEGPSDLLTRRFLEDPERWFAALSVFPDSPWEHADTVMAAPARDTYAWYPEAEQRQFQDILAAYQPKNGAEQALLDRLNAAWTQTVQLHQGDSTFCLTANGQCLTLGRKDGAYPWVYTGLPETPTRVGRGDNGEMRCAFSYGGVEVSYYTCSDGEGEISYVDRMETTDSAVRTWWGVSVGDDADGILAAYPSAVYSENIRMEDGEGAWTWPGDGETPGSHITFYMRDGKVAKIRMESLYC